MRSAKATTRNHAPLVGAVLALMFTGTVLQAQQIQQQPQQQTNPQVQQDLQQEQQDEQRAKLQEEQLARELAREQDELPASPPPPPQAERSPLHQAPPAVETLHALLRRPLVLSLQERIKRISVADPSIVDALIVSPNQILINGNACGGASLTVWDETGRSEGFDISVERDVRAVAEPLREAVLIDPVEFEPGKTPWIGWVVIASIVLLAGAILGARWQRGPRLNKLSLQVMDAAASSDSTELVAARLASIAGWEERSRVGEANDNPDVRQNGLEDVITDDATGLNAERNERLLEAYLGAAVKGMLFSAPDILSPDQHMFRERKPLWDTITALAYAIEARDPHRQGHSQAVSRLAALIARQVGLSPAEIEEIRLAGLVHDIGKIHVPDFVYNKPLPPTAEEFEIMKSHTEWGAKILEPLKSTAIESIVRHHHERYDGTGYPDGLADGKIPLGARIVAVAESFHVMISGLPYKNARTFEDGLDELRRCSGTQFDPTVVVAFFECLQIYDNPRKQQ